MVRSLNYQMRCGKDVVINKLFSATNTLLPQFIFSINQRFPFDTKNPVGFSVAIVIQYIQSICSMVATDCFTVCVFGTSALIFPLTKDMKNDLEAININAKRKRTRSKIVSQFAQFVQFHAKLIQLSQIDTFVLCGSSQS